MPPEISAHNLGDFSICVPTYNRAILLERCLNHLNGFTNQEFELIIGDNCSDDHTQDVIAAFVSKFKNLVFIRHNSNLGFARNMDALLRRATRKYIYILSDDDFLFEGALRLVKRIMEGQPQVVAVAGKYIGVKQFIKDIGIGYEDGVATILAKDDHEKLLSNFVICDGHPFIRRAIFQRHCAYWDRAIGLFPLFMQLLTHGEVVVIDKPFFQHLANSESLTGSMTEAWMLDMANVDFELALSAKDTLHLRNKLGVTRQTFLQMMYFQAARMAYTKGLFYVMWLFLKRLNAVQGASVDLLLHAERAFMHDFLVGRLVQLVQDGGFSSVMFENSAMGKLLMDVLRTHLPSLDCTLEGLERPQQGVSLYVCESFPGADCCDPSAIAVSDLFAQFRLSACDARLTALNQRLEVTYDESDTAELAGKACASFNVLCSRYTTDQ